MKRLFVSLNILVALSILFTSCQTFGERDEERQLRRLRRGVIDNSGVYTNDYYKFRVRMPEGWPGSAGDPPELLTVNPSSHHVSRTSLRRQVSIRVRVWNREKDEILTGFYERYAEANQYEKILQRPSLVEGFLSGRIMFYSKINETPFRIITLFVQKENEYVIVECSAPRNIYDNFESSFRATLDSFRSTRSELPELPQKKPDLSPLPDPEFLQYTVAPGETMESLAIHFLGSRERTRILVAVNETDSIQAGDSILIPRSLSYDVIQGDSWRTISQRIFLTAEYADLIESYNRRIDPEPGTAIQVPLYYSIIPSVGETYSDVASRVYNDDRLAEKLLEYNDRLPLESLEKLKLPIFLKELYYMYTVQAGDSLAWIARWLTGDSNNYTRIADFNNISSPYRVVVNQQIRIPAYLVQDPEVFDRPIPRPTPRSPQPPAAPSTASPTPAPGAVFTPAPTPRPITDPGIFDID